MISAVRTFINGYESLEQTALLNVEYLPSNPVNYTIVEEVMENDGVVREFVGGAQLKEYRVRLLRTTHYEQPTTTNIANSTFMRNFEEWIRSNNKSKNLPSINGVQSIRITSSGYLQAVAEDQTHAIYSVGLAVRYIKE